MVVDQELLEVRRAAEISQAERETIERVRADPFHLATHFTPRERTVVVRVERDCVVEIAKRDVPLPVDASPFDGDREVAVAWLVRLGRSYPAKDDGKDGKAEQRSRTETSGERATATVPPRHTSPLASRTSCRRRSPIQSRTRAAAAASPAAVAAARNTRASSGSRCTAQSRSASASAAAASCRSSSLKRASSRRCR